MKFEEALVELRKGKKIKICTWNDRFFISIDEADIPYDISILDFIRSTWDIVEEPGKSFPEVFDAFKEGKKIRRKDCGLYPNTNDKFILSREFFQRVTSLDLLATDWEVIE